jgi:hypothetical protein
VNGNKETSKEREREKVREKLVRKKSKNKIKTIEYIKKDVNQSKNIHQTV